MPAGTAAVPRSPWEWLLKRTRALCKGALQDSLHESAGPSTVERVRVATEDLQELIEHVDPYNFQNVWALIGKGHLAGLMALFGLALRRSSSASENSAEREAFCSLRTTLVDHLDLILDTSQAFDAGLYDSVARALVRTQSIRCYAQLLSELASQIGPSSSGPCPPRLGAMTLDVLKEVLTLLNLLTVSAKHGKLRPSEALKYSVDDARGEVDRSCLLEHWARTLMLASRCESVKNAAAGLLPDFAAIATAATDQDILATWAGNHSLAWLMTSHVVGLAAALDGGTRYDTPFLGPGAAAAPLVDTDYRRLQPHSSGFADTRLAQLALREWAKGLAGMAAHLHEPGSPWFSWGSIRELARRRLTQLEQRREDPRGVRTEEIEAEPDDEYVGVAFTTSYTMNFIRCMLPALAVPPFKVAATRDVSMRLAASATEALAEAVAAPAGGFSAAAEPTVAAPPAQPQRPRVPPDQAAALGVQALKCARAACWDVGWATEAEHPPEKLEQLQRWWDLAARFIRLAATPNQDPADGGGWKRSDLEELLPLRVTKSAAAASPTPSADVAVALRVGYPQLLELLMRRQASAGGREVDEAFANPLRGMPAYAWSQLLTFTDPRVTASLLATVAKLVRRAALRLEAASVAARAELAAGGITCADVFTAEPNSQAVYDSRRISLYAYRYNDHTKAAINIISHVLTPGESALSMADRLRSAAAAAPANTAAAHAEPGNRQRLHSSSSSSSSNGDEAGGGTAESGGATCSGTAAEGGHGGVGAGVSGIGAGDSGAGSSWDRGSSDGDCGAAISGGGSGSIGEVAPGHGTTGDEGAGGPDSTGDSEAEAAASGRQGSDPHAAAIRGLAVGVSQVAVRVLPDLVRLAVNMSAGWGKGFTWTDAMCLQLLLSWVPLLAAASAAGAAPASDMHATQEDPGREGLRDQQPATGGAATAAVSAAAAEWDSFLGVDMVLLQLLRLASTAAGMMVGDMQFMFDGFEKSRLAALRALVHFAPRRLARALMAAGSAAPATVGPALASGSRSNVSAAAASRPEPLRLLDVPRLREFLGPEGPSPDPDMLADLERWCTTSGTEVAAATGCVGTSASPAAADPPGPLPSELRQWAAAAALLVPPSEVRAALPTCDNPLCTNLEGDSEAGLRLSGCGRCGGRVRYCGRECQVAHWKAGHKAECAGAAGSASAPASLSASVAFPSTAASPSTEGLGLG